MAAEFTIKSTKELLSNRQLSAGQSVQVFVDSEVLRRCMPRIPFDSGALNRSGVIHTKLGSGRVVYSTPYARRWYYNDADFQGAPRRGKFWFQRMKESGGKEAILRGAAKLSGGRAK